MTLLWLLGVLVALAAIFAVWRESVTRSRAVSAIAVAVVVLAVASAGFAVATPTAGTELAVSNHTLADDPDATTVEGNPNIDTAGPDNNLTLSSSTLNLTVSNQGEIVTGGSHPAEIEALLTTAHAVEVDVTNTDDAPFAVTSSQQSLGNITTSGSRATFDIAMFEDAEPGEYEIEVSVEYTNIYLINYTNGDQLSYEQQSRTETVTQEKTVVIESNESGGTSPLWFLPSLLVLVATTAWIGGKFSSWIEGTVNRISRVLFGRFVSPDSTREKRIESAYIETTYRTYAAKTLLFAVLGLIAGAIAGAYLLAGLLVVLEPIVRALSGLPRTITRPIGIRPDFTLELASSTRWLIIGVGGLIIGIIVGGLAYLFRWQLPANTAEVRRRGIQEGMPRTAAFMYALARGGMEFPQILRILSDNRGVYGEAAYEMSITVREMDLFGRDMITALRRMSARTPSDQFKTFSENLTSVLQSGSDLPNFFKEQYERFREDAEERQEEVLELLATIAEGYVTVLVAGMLFFITILLVFGLTTTDTLWILTLIIYLVIPLANLGFGVFLQQKLDTLGIARRSGGKVLDRMKVSTPVHAKAEIDHRRADGGGHNSARDNRKTLAIYDKVDRVKKATRQPLKVFLRNPTNVLWVAVPIAVAIFAIRAPAAFQADGISVRIIDDYIIQSTLFVLISYAIVREIYKRRIDRIEAATPELLERLASLNEAGMSVVESIDRVRQSDLGVLTPEVQRIWRDIEYGSNVDDAIVRFGRRIRTTAVTRVVTLMTNAMRASGNMGPVLRVASEQARAEVKLRRKRRQKMLTYLVVIYVSFLVFLVIITAVNEVLVPSLPDTVPTPENEGGNRLGASADSFTRFGEVDKAAYTLIFFHAALIQAACAGFIGGQLGEGSLRDGAKHASIMLLIAYGVVILLSSPVASLSVLDTTSTGGEIQIEGASLSEGGYVAVYEDGLDGELLGHTEYLPAGSHSNIRIPLQNGEIRDTTELRIVAHRETNGNNVFDFLLPYVPEESQVDRPYSTISDGGEPGVTVNVRYTG